MLPGVGSLLTGTGVPAGLPSAHPVAGSPHLEVPVLLLALLAFAAVVATGMAVPHGSVTGTATGSATGRRDRTDASWEGGLSTAQAAVRGLAVLVLVVCVVAGRVGTANELDNIAPALVLGLGWPLLFVAALLTGWWWRWVDPWDGAARVLVRGDRSRPRDDVRPAVLVALPLLWYVAAHPRAPHPRDLGLALAVYTVVALAGCLAVGRRRWLSSSEPLGIALTWVGRSRPSWLRNRPAPEGLATLLGVFAGATLFGAFRRTEVWTELVDPTDRLAAAAGLLAAALVGGALVEGFARLAALAEVRPARAASADARSVVACAFAPAVVGMVVAVALDQNRLFTSVQLLPGLLGDPFGLDWDLFGAATSGLEPAPLGAVGLLTAQLLVLGAAHLWGAVLAARLLPRGSRLAAVLLLGQSAAGSLAVITLH